MTFAQAYLLCVLLLPLAAVWYGKIRPDVGGWATALLLGLGQYFGLGLLGPAGDSEHALKALSGLAQPVTITVFTLFVITKTLEQTGVTRSLARRVIVWGGGSENRLIALLAANAAILSLFMNNLAAGALVLPSAIEVSRRARVRASKLLLPVAYGACFGGAATYFTTPNIIVSDMLLAAHPPQAPLHILDFTPVGGLVAIVGLAFLWAFGSRFLPDREASAEQLAARRTGSELELAYQLEERQWELVVNTGSTLIGKPLVDAAIGQRFGLTVLAIKRGRNMIFGPSPRETLAVGDRIIVVGREDRAQQLAAEGLYLEPDANIRGLSSKGALFSEVVLIPQSKAEGHTLREIDFRSKYGMTAVAIRRDGRSYRTDLADIRLQQGDSILAMGGDERIKLLRSSADFLLIETDPRDQPTDWNRAKKVIAIAAVAVFASICGLPVYLSMLAAAVLMVVCNFLSIEDAYRSMEWQAILLIAGMYPVSVALVSTGLAADFGELVAGSIAPFGALGLISGAYLCTAVLSQLVPGQLVVFIVAPVFISAAIQVGTNPQALAVTTAIACSTSFLSPLAQPVTMLMLGPGNYKFGDYLRAGWKLSLLSFVALLIGMKLFWSL